MNPPIRSQRLRFGLFVLDTRRVELQREGVVVPLRPKPFALLAALASNPGTVLSREELFAAVWPSVVVSDDSLSQAVHDVRAALGDAGGHLVRTVARHGYLFDSEVVDADAAAPPLSAAPVSAGAAVQERRISEQVNGGVPAAPWWHHLMRAARRRTSFSRWTVALALVGIAAAAGVLYIDGFIGGLPERLMSAKGGRTSETGTAKAPRLSLVVLPLEVEAGSDSGDWFSDPLTMDLTRDLGLVSGMFVISRDTAFTYRGMQVDPREVARELNVRYVVRGTVRRKGNDVRLNLALIDGKTGRQHWAERFDLERADLPKSLRDVTGVVSRSLRLEVYRAEGQRAATLRPEQVEADDLAMRGWAVWLRGFSRENALEALRLFEQAVARDPDSLRGWGGVGLMNGQAAGYGWLADPAPARARQREALLQMERLDRDDMMTYFARVDPYYRRQDFAGLLQYAQTLVQRFPNHTMSHQQHATALLLLGRFDECLPPAREALRLGPRDTLRPAFRFLAAFCHFAAGRYADAAGEARLSLQENPTLPGPQLMLAAALGRNGQPEEAQKILQENQRRPMSRQQGFQWLSAGTEPRLVEARERFFGTLKELGVP
jgi:adenylate cyclase